MLVSSRRAGKPATLGERRRATMRVLVVEDEPTMLSALSDALTHERLVVDTALDGRDALGMVHVEQAYDLILLDLMMPHMDGLTFLRTIRSEGHAMPVLVLTARDLTNDKVSGLDAGADDYLTKPFDLDELLARVRALLRRNGNHKTSVLRAGAVELDTVTHVCRVHERTVTLATKEEQLLEYLLRNQGRIVPREELEDHLWDAKASLWSDTLRTHIRYLRAKLDTDPEHPLITTLRGLGYGIVAPSDKGDGHDS
ncbi:MAG: DNA-binding response regulator [Coprothermobacter sp.]|nr:DNA-binding response regulator [Coprothermobacter sp.]